MQASSGHTCYAVSNGLFTLSEKNEVLNKKKNILKPFTGNLTVRFMLPK